MSMDQHRLIDQGIIRTEGDFLRLQMVDWNRYAPYYTSPQHAMHVVSSWYLHTGVFALYDVPLDQYPERADFPTWDHPGGVHRALASAFWNYFHACYMGTLFFADMPDFSGYVVGVDPQRRQNVI